MNGLSRVSPKWFAESSFWIKSLKDTSKIFVNGFWDAEALSILVKFLPKLTKICITYWRCENAFPVFEALPRFKCKDIVIDLRGAEMGHFTAADVVKALPDKLISLFLILEEYFQVDCFKNLQKLVKSKMDIGGQAVLFFNGEFDCIQYELVNGRLKMFGFKKDKPCHIASYEPNFHMYRENKKMDAFNVYNNVYHNVSYVIGARVKVLNSTSLPHCGENKRINEGFFGAIKCSSELVISQNHVEDPQTDDNPATGRCELPKGEIFYNLPTYSTCCEITDFALCYTGCRGKEYTYGMPIFRRSRFIGKFLHNGYDFLYRNDERVNEIVYFPKYVEFHMDNGFISRPDVDELYIFRMIPASEHLIVHSTSAERRALEAISFRELLKNVETIEFRGKWWDTCVYEMSIRRSKFLKKFSSFCFQSQRGGLSELWQPYHHPQEPKIAQQLTHLTFDARDCKWNNLCDVLTSMFAYNTDVSAKMVQNFEKLVSAAFKLPGQNTAQKNFHFERVVIVASKLSGPNITAQNNCDFEKVIKILSKFTVPGAHITLAILNAIPRESRQRHNYVGESDLVNGSLHMKCCGKTLIPQIHNQCSMHQPDLILKLFRSNAYGRFWEIAIPFDCQ